MGAGRQTAFGMGGWGVRPPGSFAGKAEAAVAAEPQSLQIIWFDNEPAGTSMIRFVFAPDTDGEIRWRMEREIVGTLLRYSLTTTGGIATFTISLEDEYGHDVLDGYLVNETPGSPADTVLTTELDPGSSPPRGHRPIAVGGIHTFVFSGDADTDGVLELHFVPGFEARYDKRAYSRPATDERPEPGTLVRRRLAGVVDAVRRTYGDLIVVGVWWVSDASGNVDAWLDLHGIMDRVVTKPLASIAPTDNYDITLEDDTGVDLLNGQLANRDTVNLEAVWPYGPGPSSNRSQEVFSPCISRLRIANAGNAKQGLIVFYVLDIP